ncbi:MAG: ABC transporter ATP-binding protein [Candidatus Xenobia bacterium]
MLKSALGLLAPPARRRFALLVAGMVLRASLEVVTIGSITLCMARMAEQASDLSRPLGLALVLLIVSCICSAWVSYAAVRFATSQERELAARLLAGYLRQPYAWWLGQNSAILQQNVMSGMISRGVLEPLTTGLSQLILVALLIPLLVIVQPLVALSMTIVLGAAYALLSFLTRRYLGHLAATTQEALDQASQTSQEAMHGFKTLRLLGREDEMLRRFRLQGEQISRNQSAWSLASELPRFLLETVAVGGLLGLALYLTQTGSSTRLLPMLSLYALAGYRLIPALNVVFISWSRLTFSLPILRRFHEGLTVAPRPPSGEGLELLQELGLEQVRFTYPGAARPGLSEISLRLPRNASLGLVGPTGCGKTTLVDILVGLLEPEQGAVLLDGIPLGPASWPAWQRRIGYVPQDPFLADASLLQNIALGVAEPDLEAAERATRLANLHDFVLTLPQGYHTLVGERGVRLSGGQRQRLAIARALYHDPDLLVLDEATSALDTPTERAIRDSVAALAGKKTLVVVAHRLETVRELDQIALMEDGRLTALGTFAELLEKSPLFRQLASVGS